MSSLRRFFHIALTYVSGDRYAGQTRRWSICFEWHLRCVRSYFEIFDDTVGRHRGVAAPIGVLNLPLH